MSSILEQRLKEKQTGKTGAASLEEQEHLSNESEQTEEKGYTHIRKAVEQHKDTANAHKEHTVFEEPERLGSKRQAFNNGKQRANNRSENIEEPDDFDTEQETYGNREESFQKRKNTAMERFSPKDRNTDDDDGEDLDGETARVSEEDAELLNELDDLMADEDNLVSRRRAKKIRLFFRILLSIACLYMVILIYGAAITEFKYDENGELGPVVLSVEQIGMKNEYSTVLAMYLKARELYETILTLDYRVAAGDEDTMGIAPEYEAALDTVSTLGVQIEAADVDSRYNQIKSMLQTWVETHAAAYCQYMSAAIAQNDENAANEALAARQVVNSTFQTITQNIVIMGEDLDIDLEDVKTWSPDGYVQTVIEGIPATESVQ